MRQCSHQCFPHPPTGYCLGCGKTLSEVTLALEKEKTNEPTYDLELAYARI